MIQIPGGSFLFGAEREARRIEAFAIDPFPVTNSQYLAVAKRHSLRIPAALRSEAFLKSKADHPVVGLTQSEALAYCACLGRDLPTCEEWEKAARGTDGRVYPWGDLYDSSRCNTRESRRFDTSPVDAYKNGRSPFGVADLAGNTWEWTRSIDASGLVLVKGGSWFDPPAFARADRSLTARASYQCSSIGFRTVWRPGLRTRLPQAAALDAVAGPLPSTPGAAGVPEPASSGIAELFEISDEAARAMTELADCADTQAGQFEEGEIQRAIDSVFEGSAPPDSPTTEDALQTLEVAIARGELAGARELLESLRRQSGIEAFARRLDRCEELLTFADTVSSAAGTMVLRHRSPFLFWAAVSAALLAANLVLYWARTSGRF